MIALIVLAAFAAGIVALIVHGNLVIKKTKRELSAPAGSGIMDTRHESNRG